jgi:hypothetical protein
MFGQHVRELCHREHEYQVEEEFDESHARVRVA